MLVVCGKSASGKDTIVSKLHSLGMGLIVPYTTRPIRTGEVNGVNYHFITEQEFLEKKANGFFATTSQFKVANGDTWYYGRALEDLGYNKVMTADPTTVEQIQKIKSLKALTVYINADEKVIEKRLNNRGDDQAELKRRMLADHTDYADINNIIDLSIRNDGNTSPSCIAEIIQYTYNKMINNT